MIQRRKTRQVKVGNVLIGGDAPVSVQSMTSGYTYEIDKCVAEIHKLPPAGRISSASRCRRKRTPPPSRKSCQQVKVPIVADVHFHFQRALEAIEAGIHKIRLNPGNISDQRPGRRGHPRLQGPRNPHPHRRQRRLHRRTQGQTKTPQGTGRRLLQQQARPPAGHHDRQARGIPRDLPRAAISTTSSSSAKSHRPAAGRSTPIPKSPSASITRCTWASPTPGPRKPAPSAAWCRWATCCAAASATPSASATPTIRSTKCRMAWNCSTSWACGTRIGAELIACPTCGRIQVDLFKLVQEVRKELAEGNHAADQGGRDGLHRQRPRRSRRRRRGDLRRRSQRGIIYVQGEKVANVPEAQILDSPAGRMPKFQDKVTRRRSQTGRKSRRYPPPRPDRRTGQRLQED